MTAIAVPVAYIGLGANLGDAAGSLRNAFLAIDRISETRLLCASGLYRSAAWGRADQPDFVNAVAAVTCHLPPAGLLEALLQIERDAGRVRDPLQRWGPRELDLDLLLYADEVSARPGLRLPHPHLHQRAFVLLPLLEIAPDIVIPGIGPARDCLAQVDAGEVVALS